MDSIEKKLGDCEYLRVIFADINAIPRVKVLSRRSVAAFYESGLTCFSGVIGFSCDGHPNTGMKMIQENHCANGVLKADWSTLVPAPYASKSGAKFFDVIATVYSNTLSPNDVHPVDTRQIALRAVKELQNLGLTIKSTFEIEFRLFKDEDMKQPVWTTLQHQSAYLQSGIEEFLTNLERACAGAGILFELSHTEYGSGQIEVNVVPSDGIAAADQGFMFKVIAKEVARKHGYYAGFMTKPIPEETGNAWHYNFSVWSKEGNVFYKDGKESSVVAKQFLAGQIAHAAGLLALSAPTVNCYRRIHTPWAPHLADWGLDDRMTAFRVHTYSKKAARIESRLVCSAVNPYLAVAATIFAGLDGIRKEMSLPTRSFKELPHTFSESLQALKSDSVLVDSLGAELVEWLEVSKVEVDLVHLSTSDVKSSRPEDFAAEIKEYGFL